MSKGPKIPNMVHHPKKQSLQLDAEILNIFQQGLNSHKMGQLSQAKAAYEQVLRTQPKNFDSHIS